jgi:hypothetical protein
MEIAGAASTGFGEANMNAVGAPDRRVMIVAIGLALYAAVGVAVAAAFVVFGVTRVLPDPVPVTVGARVLIFPGAAALWPYVLVRWLKSVR